jgi:hypothetical protein
MKSLYFLRIAFRSRLEQYLVCVNYVPSHFKLAIWFVQEERVRILTTLDRMAQTGGRRMGSPARSIGRCRPAAAFVRRAKTAGLIRMQLRLMWARQEQRAVALGPPPPPAGGWWGVCGGGGCGAPPPPPPPGR